MMIITLVWLIQVYNSKLSLTPQLYKSTWDRKIYQNIQPFQSLPGMKAMDQEIDDVQVNSTFADLWCAFHLVCVAYLWATVSFVKKRKKDRETYL